MTTSDKRLSRLIAPGFFPVHRDMRAGKHTHYWLMGGRGSGKSSFAALEILTGIMRAPGTNAVVCRKVAGTLESSVLAQMRWAAGMLGVGTLWDATRSPPRMVYRPTGQEILFRGLDKASKQKSIKAAGGYFKYLWLEELDEFSGMGEVRAIVQSVLRGGDGQCICTYNPPRSARCWVNAEALAGAAGRLVHHSDYRGVPPAWLGESFLTEAARLEAADETAYRHEYLGEAAGTGNEVFANLTLRPVGEDEIAAAGRVQRGLDFGYAVDPAHYTVCAFDPARGILKIFEELHARRWSNERLAREILAEMARNGRGNVCCDSSDPKSIDDLYLLGVPVYGAKKGAGSVEWGMRFLAREVREIVIDPVRCPNTAREFSHYCFEDDGRGGMLAEYPDRDNHSIDAVRYALESAVRARFAGRGGASGGTYTL